MKDSYELKNLKGMDIENQTKHESNSKISRLLICLGFYSKNTNTNETQRLVTNQNIHTIVNGETQKLTALYNKLININTDTITKSNYDTVGDINTLKAWSLVKFENRKKHILTVPNVRDLKKLIRNTLIQTNEIVLPSEATMRRVELDIRRSKAHFPLGAIGALLSFSAFLICLIIMADGYGLYLADKSNHKSQEKEDLRSAQFGLLGGMVSLGFFIISLSLIFKLEEIPLLIFNSLHNSRIHDEYHRVFKIDPADFKIEEVVEESKIATLQH